jgi:enoyl-CoA hydratase/carnithine racemase
VTAPAEQSGGITPVNESGHVRYEVRGEVAVIILNRPEQLNAFTDVMERELIECFDRSDADDAVRVVVVTGSGRAFCAGMDLAEAEPTETFAAWRRSETAPAGTQYAVPGEDLPVRRDGGGRVVLRMYDSLKPIVAAINGHAVGVGATLTLAADLRLGTEGAKFAFPFVRRGFVLESCSSWFLPRVVPHQVAMEWMLTGRTFDADEALRGGLLRSVHPPGQTLEAALALAHEIAEPTSPVTVAVTRRLLWRMLAADHPMRAHELETLVLNERGVSADAGEGVTAFLDKRRPTFADRVTTDLPTALDGPFGPDYMPPGTPI